MFVNQIEGYCRWPTHLLFQRSFPRSFLPSADWRGGFPPTCGWIVTSDAEGFLCSEGSPVFPLVSHLKPPPDCTACSCRLLLPVPKIQLLLKMPIKLSREPFIHTSCTCSGLVSPATSILIPPKIDPSAEGGTLCLVALGTADGNAAEQRCRQKHRADSNLLSVFRSGDWVPNPLDVPKNPKTLRKKIGAIWKNWRFEAPRWHPWKTCKPWPFGKLNWRCSHCDLEAYYSPRL